MTEPVIDDLDQHLQAAGSIDRAVVPMAMYLAWCANLHLLDSEFLASHESAVLRLRYREITPAEFLTTTCGGRLSREIFNADGRRFTETYYESFLDDFTAAFGDDVYSVKDGWATYDEIARVLTRRYMGNRPGDAGRGEKKWWQVWR